MWPPKERPSVANALSFFIPTSDTCGLNRLNHGVITSLAILLTRALAHTMSSECLFQI